MASSLIVSKKGNRYINLGKIVSNTPRTEKAIMFRKKVWIPSSQSFEKTEYQGCGIHVTYLYVREWLANKLKPKIEEMENKEDLEYYLDSITSKIAEIHNLFGEAFSSHKVQRGKRRIKYLYEDLSAYLTRRDLYLI